MDEPRSLDSVFKEKLFRIPDYQRGYAWGREQREAFWEDLVNLPSGRSHYTGVLTLKAIPARAIRDDEKEHWLIEDHSYNLFHIVDGQQRLTTFIIFLQAFVEFIRSLPNNTAKRDNEIYITETLSIDAVEKKFLFMIKPQGDQFRTYKFGYTDDNPSYRYMRHRIMGEAGGGTVFETFYTLNLSNAKLFFLEQLQAWHEAVRDHMTDLGDDVQERFLKWYIAFKRLKNFATVQLQTQKNGMLMWLPLNPKEVVLEDGFSRDVSGVGHHGTGDLELTIRNLDDLNKAKPLIQKSFEEN